MTLCAHILHQIKVGFYYSIRNDTSYEMAVLFVKLSSKKFKMLVCIQVFELVSVWF